MKKIKLIAILIAFGFYGCQAVKEETNSTKKSSYNVSNEKNSNNNGVTNSNSNALQTPPQIPNGVIKN